MSLAGEINKVSGEVRDSVGRIARHGIVGLDGSARGTRKIVGYVCAVNEGGELAGTVDVQEYGYDEPGAGLHRGVLLSAVQDNSGGPLVVPLLFSEVVIVQNPSDGCEYVLMYSHAQKWRALAREAAEIGVEEVEAFAETEDGLEKDYDELEPTGRSARTTYAPGLIRDRVTSAESLEGLSEEKTAERKTLSVGATRVAVDGASVSVETSGEVRVSIGSTEITVKDGQVVVKSDSVKVESRECEVKGSSVKVEGSSVEVAGGTLKVKGASSPDLQGPFNAIKVCPFTGAPHCGSLVSGT